MTIKIKKGEEGFSNTFQHYDENIPQEWQQELYNYYICGYSPGSFHTAVFANDLHDAACRSHVANRWSDICAFVRWILEFAPYESYGSRSAVKAWLKLSAEERREIAQKKRWVLPEAELVWKIVSEEAK